MKASKDCYSSATVTRKDVGVTSGLVSTFRVS